MNIKQNNFSGAEPTWKMENEECRIENETNPHHPFTFLKNGLTVTVKTGRNRKALWVRNKPKRSNLTLNSFWKWMQYSKTKCV